MLLRLRNNKCHLFDCSCTGINMSKFAKRKHYIGLILGQEIDSLGDKQSIVKIMRSKGNNLHEVEDANGESYLMSMPTKFRNVVYVKIGDYVLVESIDEGDKVRAEMINVILPEQIPDYIKRGIWPERFRSVKHDKIDDLNVNMNSDSEDELFGNVNRPQQRPDTDSSEEDSDD